MALFECCYNQKFLVYHNHYLLSLVFIFIIKLTFVAQQFKEYPEHTILLQAMIRIFYISCIGNCVALHFQMTTNMKYIEKGTLNSIKISLQVPYVLTNSFCKEFAICRTKSLLSICFLDLGHMTFVT